MKRLFLLAALSCVAAFGINTATASAGNCTTGFTAMAFSNPSIDPPPWGPYDALNLGSCTGVTAAEFSDDPDGVNYSGWYDQTLGVYPDVFLCTSGLTTSSCSSHANVLRPYSASFYSVLYYHPVYGGGTAHWVHKSGWFRIKSGSTWGPWHFVWDDAGQAATV